ncbi:hypothetical protein H4V95_001214 [Arthrobacter sp. CAN_C5]|nr:hypothetical protein [Arthrobacter sp. CAN_C5]
MEERPAGKRGEERQEGQCVKRFGRSHGNRAAAMGPAQFYIQSNSMSTNRRAAGHCIGLVQLEEES